MRRGGLATDRERGLCHEDMYYDEDERRNNTTRRGMQAAGKEHVAGRTHKATCKRKLERQLTVEAEEDAARGLCSVSIAVPRLERDRADRNMCVGGEDIDCLVN